MDSLITTIGIALSLVGAWLAGRWVRRSLRDDHLSADSVDAVKLATGLVATMTALILGLLVSSAKDTYDTERGEIIQMASKVAFLDRMLSLYGADAANVRRELHDVVVDAVERIWPEARDVPVRLNPNQRAGDAFFMALQGLAPTDDTHRDLKAQAATLAIELGELRTLLVAQSVPSVSTPLLLVVVCWLVVIFFSSSVVAPPNAMTAVALIAAAFSVAGAIFLILELDQPFAGLLRISSDPVLAALRQIAH
jgi:hypothetical protein